MYLLQAAHLAHVLFAANGVDHAAGAEEESALKNACVIRWKMPAENAPTPQRQEHVAELRDGRVGENFLDIVLREADGGGEERGQRADDGDDRQAHPGRGQKMTCERATM